MFFMQRIFQFLSFGLPRRGVVALVTLLIITTAIVIFSLSIGFLSINQNQIILDQSESSRLFGYTDGCMEEAYTKIRRLGTYTGETFLVDDVSCIIAVTSSESNRTVTVTATRGNYTRSLRSVISLSPTFSITSWQEI